MKTIYFGAMSLDGYIADRNNSLDWLFQFGEPPEGYIEKFVSGVGAIAMGSTTYRWLLTHLETTTPKQSWPYSMPAFVFTHRSDLKKVDDADIRFVSGSVAPVHAEMRAVAREKNLWIMGGGDLAAQFHDAGLLDELQLQVAPVTLGSGAPVFPRHLKKPFALRSVRPFHEKFFELIYDAKG